MQTQMQAQVQRDAQAEPRVIRRGRRPNIGDNPWGLTINEERTMRALCEHGSHKGAAKALCCAPKTVEGHVFRIGRKMPQHRTPLARAIVFDRWDRARLTSSPA